MCSISSTRTPFPSRHFAQVQGGDHARADRALAAVLRAGFPQGGTAAAPGDLGGVQEEGWQGWFERGGRGRYGGIRYGFRRARSRLYRSQILQVNTRWKALVEIYTMHSFAPFSNLKFFVMPGKGKRQSPRSEIGAQFKPLRISRRSADGPAESGGTAGRARSRRARTRATRGRTRAMATRAMATRGRTRDMFILAQS